LQVHDLNTNIAESNIQLQTKLSATSTKELDKRKQELEREIAKSQAFLRQYGSGSESSAAEMKEDAEKLKAEALIAQLRLDIETLKTEEKDINALLRM
jgi:uncharacterized protein YbjQ (UPF0145 family)